MQTSHVKMTFKCPVSWDGMQPREEGRFCENCRIVVKDFTDVPLQQLNEKTSECEGETCGRFRIDQLHNPFGNWKDSLVKLYQAVELRPRRNKVVRSMMLLLVMAMLILAGCRPRRHIYAGKYLSYDGGFNPRNMSAPPGVAQPAPSKVKRTTVPPVVVPAGRIM